jgi:hypothetical protein
VDEVLRLVEQRLQHSPALIKIRADAYRTERDADLEGDRDESLTYTGNFEFEITYKK